MLPKNPRKRPKKPRGFWFAVSLILWRSSLDDVTCVGPERVTARRSGGGPLVKCNCAIWKVSGGLGALARKTNGASTCTGVPLGSAGAGSLTGAPRWEGSPELGGASTAEAVEGEAAGGCASARITGMVRSGHPQLRFAAELAFCNRPP